MISGLFPFIPVWLEYLMIGLTVLLLLVSAGIAIGKSGRHPIWALLLLLPGVQIILFWVFAYARWPTQKRDFD